MTDPIRAALERLVGVVQQDRERQYDTMTLIAMIDPVAEALDAARAALAQSTPPAEGEPTDEELESFLLDVAAEQGDFFCFEPLVLARAVLARYGHQPAPPAEALAARPLLERVARMGDCIGTSTFGDVIAVSVRAAAWLAENPPGQPVKIEPRGCPTPSAADLLEQCHPAPVPVSERPWEREGWGDELGRCWLLDRDGSTWKLMTCEWMLLPGDLRYRWLLPAHALPLPTTEPQP